MTKQPSKATSSKTRSTAKDPSLAKAQALAQALDKGRGQG